MPCSFPKKNSSRWQQRVRPSSLLSHTYKKETQHNPRVLLLPNSKINETPTRERESFFRVTHLFSLSTYAAAAAAAARSSVSANGIQLVHFSFTIWLALVAQRNFKKKKTHHRHSRHCASRMARGGGNSGTETSPPGWWPNVDCCGGAELLLAVVLLLLRDHCCETYITWPCWE